MTLWKQGASAVPVLARLRIILGSATPMTIMVARMRRGANSITSAVPIGQHARPDADAGKSKNDPKPGKNGNSGCPLFPKSHLPVFALLFAFEELSKSLITL